MARDLPINTVLYFYDIGSKIYTGEQGDAGDATTFIMPEGMTPVEPLVYDLDTEVAIFDEGNQTWSKRFIDAYLNMNQTEKDLYDEQVAINTAQQKYIDRLGETMDKLLGYIASTNPLTAPQQLFVDEFRNDYADYIAKRDA